MLTSYVRDPITELVAFPSFHAGFPAYFERELNAGRSVAIAIGDVDDMKRYVERKRRADDLCFGHLAGNALMAQLGTESLAWFSSLRGGSGCISTFGGDELILAMGGIPAGEFERCLQSLTKRLSEALPCSVSFAYATFEAPRGATVSRDHYARALVLVDRALLRAKAARGRDRGGRVVALRPRTVNGDGWRVRWGRGDARGAE